jgi:cytoplasmic iron level regulating protein YaaA (DUF328/UPF0246 family)
LDFLSKTDEFNPCKCKILPILWVPNPIYKNKGKYTDATKTDHKVQETIVDYYQYHTSVCYNRFHNLLNFSSQIYMNSVYIKIVSSLVSQNLKYYVNKKGKYTTISEFAKRVNSVMDDIMEY